VLAAPAAPVTALADLGRSIEQLAREGAPGPSGGLSGEPPRIEVEIGTLDPRLKLAPCERVEPYLPPGLPAWGRTRIGLKCTQGAKAWNVTLPITVHAFRQAQVLTAALPAGTVLDASHLMSAEVDLAAAPGAAVLDARSVLGRSLARPLAAGATLRQPDLKARQWFAAGDTVKVVAVGPGWSIATEGQAMSPGIEGQTIRVRTENGRLVQGRPVADRQVEVGL
jgi:flagella basal body P-ring formation protein FlgA